MPVGGASVSSFFASSRGSLALHSFPTRRSSDTLLEDYPEITRLPAELFYQTSPGQLSDAVATHHAAGSWKTVDSYRNAVKLAEKRNFELRGQIENLQRELEATRARLARAEAD